MTLATASRAALGFVANQDVRLMRRVQRWRPRRWVRWWMIAATRGGDGWIWWAQALVVLLAGGRQRFAALAAGALACGLGIQTFLTLKRLIGRRRPSLRDRHNWARLLPPDEFSFPSGHTMVAFAFAISLGHFYPDLLPWFLFCAISVAASRIVLGLHFLSDVVAGCAIGCGLGHLAALLIA
jgi:undecaprenyl-diphosphatase